jgi:hypothetical protein
VGHRYISWSGATSTLTTPLSGISVTTTKATIHQVLADPNYPVRIIQWGYQFLGSSLPTSPVQFELLATSTVFATLPNAGVVGKWGDPTGPASQATLSTTATAFGVATNEGTITSSRLLDQHAYPADWDSQFPLGREPVLSAGECLRIRATATSGTASVVTKVIWEIG